MCNLQNIVSTYIYIQCSLHTNTTRNKANVQRPAYIYKILMADIGERNYTYTIIENQPTANPNAERAAGTIEV